MPRASLLVWASTKRSFKRRRAGAPRGVDDELTYGLAGAGGQADVEWVQDAAQGKQQRDAGNEGDDGGRSQEADEERAQVTETGEVLRCSCSTIADVDMAVTRRWPPAPSAMSAFLVSLHGFLFGIAASYYSESLQSSDSGRARHGPALRDARYGATHSFSFLLRSLPMMK